MAIKYIETGVTDAGGSKAAISALIGGTTVTSFYQIVPVQTGSKFNFVFIYE